MPKNAIEAAILGGLIALTAGCTTEPVAIKAAERVRDKMEYVLPKDQYGTENYVASVAEIKKSRYKGNCVSTAMVVAAELKKYDYAPLVLDLYRNVSILDDVISDSPYAFPGSPYAPGRYHRFKPDEKRIGHEVAIYMDPVTHKYGAIGISRGEDRPAKCSTITELVRVLKMPYDATGWETDTFAVYDLNKLYPNGLWLNGTGNLYASRSADATPIAHGSK